MYGSSLFLVILLCIMVWPVGLFFASGYFKDGNKFDLILSIIIVMIFVSTIITVVCIDEICPVDQEKMKLLQETHPELFEEDDYNILTGLLPLIIFSVISIIIIGVISGSVTEYATDNDTEYRKLYIDSHWRSYL